MRESEVLDRFERGDLVRRAMEAVSNVTDIPLTVIHLVMTESYGE